MSEAMAIAASLYNNPRYYSESEIHRRNNKIRRQQIVRRQYITISALAFIAMFLIMFNIFSFKVSAQSDSFVPEYKYYKSVMIHSGDSLWSIANSDLYISVAHLDRSEVGTRLHESRHLFRHRDHAVRVHIFQKFV